MALLASCGGGVSFGVGIGDDWDDYPPRVSLAVVESAARPGQTVRLVAAAADENGIYQVTFYRYDGDTPVVLGAVGPGPSYEWVTVVPADGRPTFSVIAQATDNSGRTGDSNIVTFNLTP